MSKTINLNYEQSTGNVTDKNGIHVGCYLGLVPVESEQQESQTSDIDAVIKLKNAGFTCEEILKLRASDG